MDTDVQQLPLPLSSMASAAISKSSTGSARFGTVVADNPIKLEDRIKIEVHTASGKEFSTCIKYHSQPNPKPRTKSCSAR